MGGTTSHRNLAGRWANMDIWSDHTAESARWEQAASNDGGQTWAPNRVMEFRRVKADDSAG